MSKSPRKILEKKLDTVWSIKVRERAGNCCEYCGSTNMVQAHHIIPRTHKGTRWDINNGTALCFRHHLHWAHKDSIAFYEWISTKRNIEVLKIKGYSVSKWAEADLKLLHKELSQLVCEPQSCNNKYAPRNNNGQNNQPQPKG